MTYTCTVDPSYTDEEFDVLFNDSWDYIEGIFSGYTQQEVRDRQRGRVKRMDVTLGCYEDGHLLALISGALEGGVVKLVSAFFGRDFSGSRAYVYSDDWVKSVDDLLDQNFEYMYKTTIDETPIDNYDKARRPTTLVNHGEPVREESVVEEGVVYNVAEFRLSTT